MTSAHRPDPTQPVTDRCAYNLFRSKSLPDIVCAVPEDRPVPNFIDSDQWAFEQPLRPSDACPAGFHEHAARAGVRFNGFYLFYALASSSVIQSALEIMTGGF